MDAMIAELLGTGNDDGQLRVIVTVKPGAKTGLIKRRRRRAPPSTRTTRSSRRLRPTCPTGSGARLQHPDVVTISSDAVVEGSGITTAVTGTSANSTYSLRATLGIQNSTLTGNGIAVAVIDSGIHPSGDFGQKADRIVAFRDFTLGGLATAPQDPHGHGTHVAGIIAGDKIEALGVATKVNLVGLRVLMPTALASPAT